MRPEIRQEVQEWLLRADRDLLVAARALEGPFALGEMTAYHAQQAAEKALKGFLVAREQVFPTTHDVLRILSQCRDLDGDFGRFLDAARILTPYATLFRYPGGPLEPDQSEAKQALDLAAEIVQFVYRLIPAVPPFA